MDDPVRDISPIVHTLCQGSPQEQEHAINTYFTPDASFTHPFCRTWSFNGSRLLIHGIFRWYKIMSPKIDLHISSIAYDEPNAILYLTLTQTFAIWFIPFHRSPVTLTTVLHLTQTPPPDSPSGSPKKHYIAAQNDLYQTNQLIRFVLPWGLGTTLVALWHAWATCACVLLAWAGLPFTWMEERWAKGRRSGWAEGVVMRGVEGLEERRMRGFGGGEGGGMGNADANARVADAVGEVAGRVRMSGSGSGSGARVEGDDDRVRGRTMGGFGSEGAGDKMQFGSMQVVRP